MGKRKEESVSKLPSHKRQRQEHTDEHSDESSEEENSQFSADNSFSLTSVSYPKKSSPKIDIKKKKSKPVSLVDFEANLKYRIQWNQFKKMKQLEVMTVMRTSE